MEAHPDEMNHRPESQSHDLGPGRRLLITRHRSQSPCVVEHEEVDDVVSFGFHLIGGNEFAFPGTRIRTTDLDCWSAAAPAGARSVVRFGERGFRSISIRCHPERAAELLHGAAGPAAQLPGAASRTVAAVRGRTLDPGESALMHALLSIDCSTPADDLYRESAAMTLLAAQLRAWSAPAPASRGPGPADRRRLERAREYLDAHLDAPPGLIALARIAGLNDFKLKRDFKRLYGCTVYQYVRRQRMARAAGILKDGAPVADAAAVAGYASSGRFAFAFRQHFGVNPSQFRR